MLLGGKLSVCHAAVGAGEGVVVVAEKSSPRAIRALWDSRGALLKLTLYVLIAGLALAAWSTRLLFHIMNLKGLPLLDWEYGTEVVVGAMLLATGALLWLLRRFNWL